MDLDTESREGYHYRPLFCHILKFEIDYPTGGVPGFVATTLFAPFGLDLALTDVDRPSSKIASLAAARTRPKAV